MIFFDLDGVLLDSNGLWLQVDKDFLGRRGLKATEEYAHTVGHSIFPVAAKFTKEYYHLDETPEAIMSEWTDMAYDAYAHTLPMKEGALELLQRQKELGRPMALFTAALPTLCRAALAHHGLKDYFQDVFYAQEVGMEKKDPSVYRIAAEKYRVSVFDCVLLEDAPYNCAAARAAGYTVIGVYDDFYASRWEEVKKNSHQAVKSLVELLPDPRR